MPATQPRKSENEFVLGVDGCPAGWVFVALDTRKQDASAGVVKTIDTLLSGPGRDARVIMVDMPIGLKDRGKRLCEAEARKYLGPRRSSIFPSPLRPMLDIDTYAEANAWGKTKGAGLSKQSWNIMGKIKELDTAMTPALQAKVKEAHPEVAFTRLRGAPCDLAKRKPEGVAERLAALEEHGFPTAPETLYSELRKTHRAKDVKPDDLIDASALTLSGLAFLKGQCVRLGDQEKDARGLIMEIIG